MGLLLAGCNHQLFWDYFEDKFKLRLITEAQPKKLIALAYLSQTYYHFTIYVLKPVLPWIVTSFNIASKCSFSEAVAWCNQASMSPTYLHKDRNFHVNRWFMESGIQNANQKKKIISYTFLLVLYLRGSWECISIGRGVPPRPPLVRASIKPRTTALLLAVPNSSSVYLLLKHENRLKKTSLPHHSWLVQLHS